MCIRDSYNSTDIPYERGEILDRNGNVLANSEKTYSLILEPVNIPVSYTHLDVYKRQPENN